MRIVTKYVPYDTIIVSKTKNIAIYFEWTIDILSLLRIYYYKNKYGK